MRISTTWNHQLGVDAMLEQQSKLSDTQLKLSSGKKYLSPSENAPAAVSLINLEQNIKENQQFQTNIGAARQRLELQESSLENATNVLQRIRELAVQGMNDSNTVTNRQEIAAEIDELNKQLLGMANTKNANGEYLFAGYKSDTIPFDTTTYAYQGDANQRSIAIGPSRTITDGDAGEAVFGVYSAGTLTPGGIDNAFQAINRLSQDLKANTPNSGSLDDIDRAMVRFETTRASTGARLHALDDQQNLNTDYILANKTTASAIGDLDYADALSKFSLQQTSLQAAQAAFTKVQNLSLFNYIS
ncbi:MULTISPECIES: flagellar hook-associated protein FlgL [Methylomonas]|uniref:Flagellar hook protein n=1 Tax=Methylomonas koyamae TaxID=702114 RepID=A0A177PFN8_9GAMM|nr:flagellar hook-associated protein FlgL [Methylomonas koyamae]OAI29148.1 flagellar hook protein [Methylomonas koyamae]